ncbi:hypothetical protein GUJ93_ZPchr0002g23388 [Zizania palustris]|uniref:Uncharacterized protein n=1 Tax=Zizania palustris TaxID=103762 RepID=A0A8J5SPA0_ZIZPA|nr:hypothetical protein GUJ93_ZPchr0002g23388 [Zizania palustris]
MTAVTGVASGHGRRSGGVEEELHRDMSGAVVGGAGVEEKSDEQEMEAGARSEGGNANVVQWCNWHHRGAVHAKPTEDGAMVPPKGLRRWYLRRVFGGVSPECVRCLLAAAVQRSVLVGGVRQYTMTGFVPMASGLRRRRTGFEPGEPGSSGRLDARGAGSSVTVAAKVVRVGPRVEACQVKAESAECGSG